MTHSDNVLAIPGGGTASNSGPHADSRDMEIRADGSILEGDDGGIVIRTNPESNSGDWFGLCGNMQAFETHNVAYEPILGTVLFGNQDTGTIYGQVGNNGTYTTIGLGDGNSCMIDYTSDDKVIYLYFGTQNYGTFNRRSISKENGTETSTVDITGNWGGFLGDFAGIAAMNPSDQRMFAIALRDDFFPADDPALPANKLTLTRDRGNTFSTITLPFSKSVTAMAWSADDSSLFLANLSDIFRCTVANTISCDFVGTVDSLVHSLAVDPFDSNILVAVTTKEEYAQGNIQSTLFPGAFQSLDGGITWDNITEGGSLLGSAANGGCATYISKGSTSTVVIGSSNGIIVPGEMGGWQLLATGLPKVPVVDMVYNAEDDILVVATFGRGVWFLDEASTAVDPAVRGRASTSKWASRRAKNSARSRKRIAVNIKTVPHPQNDASSYPVGAPFDEGEPVFNI